MMVCNIFDQPVGSRFGFRFIDKVVVFVFCMVEIIQYLGLKVMISKLVVLVVPV